MGFSGNARDMKISKSQVSDCVSLAIVFNEVKKKAVLKLCKNEMDTSRIKLLMGYHHVTIINSNIIVVNHIERQYIFLLMLKLLRSSDM